jgi:hypothetical protein
MEARFLSMPWLRRFIIRAELTPMILLVEGEVVGGEGSSDFFHVVYFIFDMPMFILQILRTHQMLLK